MESEPTVREDLGYNTKSGKGMAMPFQKYQTQNAAETSSGLKILPEDRIRIEYIRGMMAGMIVVMAQRFAEPVIQRGFAREYKIN